MLESNGHFAMVDTGYSEDVENTINYLKSVGVEKFDFILITHWHNDHVGGLKEILQTFEVDKIYVKTFKMSDNNTTAEKKLYNEFIELVKNLQTEVIYTEQMGSDTYTMSLQQMEIKLYNLEKFNTTNKNAESIVAYIKIDNTKTILTSDASPSLKDMLNNIAQEVGANVHVYKIPHHSRDNSAKAEEFNPENIIITNSKTSSNFKEDKIEIYPNATRYFVNDTQNAVVIKYNEDSVNISTK